MEKQKMIHHSASGISVFWVECYYRHDTSVWGFELKSFIGEEAQIKVVAPQPSQEYLNIYFNSDLMKWREFMVKDICDTLLTQTALNECDYCASKKAQRVDYKIPRNHTVEQIFTSKVVDTLFAKHLLEREDYACLYKVTVSWNCYAWYERTK